MQNITLHHVTSSHSMVKKIDTVANTMLLYIALHTPHHTTHMTLQYLLNIYQYLLVCLHVNTLTKYAKVIYHMNNIYTYILYSYYIIYACHRNIQTTSRCGKRIARTSVTSVPEASLASLAARKAARRPRTAWHPALQPNRMNR